MSFKCVVCQKRAYSNYCVQHKLRKALKSYKRPKQQSGKEEAYQAWKEAVARPGVIWRDGNVCACCGKPARFGEKLDLDHIDGKGHNPARKMDMSNLQLLCRFPCHRLKTDGKPCIH